MTAATAAQAPKPTPRMALAAVMRGQQEKPYRLVLYGAEGLGKSTFAAQAPAPIFVEPDAGSAHLDVARFPKPESWDDIRQAVTTLTDEPHDFKTFVLDTTDAAEPLLFAKLCGEHHVDSIEDIRGGFGKGYVAAVEQWRVLLNDIERMQTKRGMHVIFLAHTSLKTIHDAGREAFDKWIMRMNEKAAGVIREWCVDVLFTELDIVTAKDAKTKRVRGFSSGERIIHAQPHAAWYAKSRPTLPDPLPLSWDSYVAGKRAGGPADPDKLIAAITENATRLSEDLQKQTAEALERCGKDAVKLAQLDNWVRAGIAATAE